MIGIFLSIQYSCSSSEEIPISETVQFEGKIYHLTEENPFSGFVFENYGNGKREFQGQYKMGKPNGMLTYFYEDGSIKREGNLKNGSSVGKWTYYNLDGSIKNIVNH